MGKIEQSTHFLFIAGALRERTSLESAQLQLAHELWGLRTALIRDNLRQYLTAESQALVYALKIGICAGFRIASEVLPIGDLSEFIREDLRNETACGFVRITGLRSWESSPEESLEVLRRTLEVPDQAELTRRLNLGMHGLTQHQYDAIVASLNRKSE